VDEVDVGSQDVCVGYKRTSVLYSVCFYERNSSKSCIGVLAVTSKKKKKKVKRKASRIVPNVSSIATP
jgi:hypothetical protein